MMSRMLNTAHESNMPLNSHSKHNKPSQFIDFALKNASVTSIKIPLVRHSSRDIQNYNNNNNNNDINYNHYQQQMASKIQHSPCQTPFQNSSLGVESDLTELSWLTNNVQMFQKNASFGLIGSPQQEAMSTVDFSRLGKLFERDNVIL